MPAWRLNSEQVAIRQYDTAGFDSESTAEFVAHVSLSQEERQGLRRANVGIGMVHMGPPLRSTPRGRPVQIIATAELDARNFPQIKAFIDELLLEYGAKRDREKRRKKVSAEDQYIISPPAKEPDAEKPYWRFSCAGFVMRAYQYAGIDLIAEDQLPHIALSALKQAYPIVGSRLDLPDEREKFGLARDADAWPVVLAGYVINSLARESRSIREEPYRPVRGDEYFPPRRVAEAPQIGSSKSGS